MQGSAAQHEFYRPLVWGKICSAASSGMHWARSTARANGGPCGTVHGTSCDAHMHGCGVLGSRAAVAGRQGTSLPRQPRVRRP